MALYELKSMSAYHLYGGGRKGGTNTAIPHQNLANYRNRSYKWEKVDIVNTTNPPFK